MKKRKITDISKADFICIEINQENEIKIHWEDYKKENYSRINFKAEKRVIEDPEKVGSIQVYKFNKINK